MSSPALEVLLARLYVEPWLREAFLSDPERVAREAGLDSAACAALRRIDREGLKLAADSYARKRERARQPRKWWR